MITAAELRLASQLRADGATALEAAQVIELARQAARWGPRTIELIGMRVHSESHASAWRSELRGPHGEWVSSGATLSSSTTIERDRGAAEQEDAFRRIAREEAIKAAAIQAGKVRSVVEQDQGRQIREQEAQIRQLQKQVRTANQHVAKLAEQTEGKKAKTKSLAVISSLVGGAVIGGVEAAVGAPGLATVLSSIAPGVIESLFEWKKRL